MFPRHYIICQSTSIRSAKFIITNLSLLILRSPNTITHCSHIISSIVNAPTAVRALIGAAEQIEKWMNKASDVLNGLDAEDDVEWAAAGGREGLEEVDKAVVKFESLVDVYVKAIENVQLRDDINDVRPQDLTAIVAQMDATLKNWASIRTFLKGVKASTSVS